MHFLRSGAHAVALTVFSMSSLLAQSPVGIAPRSKAVRLPRPLVQASSSRPTRAPVGEIEVVVQLATDGLASAQVAALARKQALGPAQQRAHVEALAAQQNALFPQLRGLGGREVARLTKSLNAVVIAIDAQRLPEIRRLPGVRSARPVRDYKLDLSETTPYVGAATVRKAGFDGKGRRIAILDSGIDYTHAEFGGPGTVAAYSSAYGLDPWDERNRTRDGLFPTKKVTGGHDFVGEEWPYGPREEDLDPIDYQGHGTHVADIVAGKNGMAPGATLLAVKVCSALGSMCDGVALLLGVEYALSPDGDHDISDAVDIMNISIGRDYGQEEDDLTQALQNAVALGVVVVASAGNAGDRPYIAGAPANAPTVISAAQTEVPRESGFAVVVTSPASIAGKYGNALLTPWAPLESVITGQLKRPPLDSGGLGVACEALDAHVFDNKIALIDRGECDFSDKVNYAALAGAEAVIIVNNEPGEALPLGQGNLGAIVPTISVGQDVGDIFKAALAQGSVVVKLDPAAAVSLAGSMVVSSSRGPSYSLNSIKPDIGAPGGSISAEVGTGQGMTAFGGTSGAAPVVTGAAALVKQAYPTIAPYELKARLMNTAESEVFTTKVAITPELAPITRIGGGEVRVDRAIATKTIAWEQSDSRVPSLSFGYHAVNAGVRTFTKTLVVRNYAAMTRTYTLKNEFRYANDEAMGAVKMKLSPEVLTVPANSTATVNVTLTLTPSLLPAWTLNGGYHGGDGFRLQEFEFDGYVRISDATDEIQVPWHVLPHRAAAVRASTRSVALNKGAGSLTLTNTSGATRGSFDVFSLIGTSLRAYTSNLPRPGDNYAFVDLQALGVRLFDMGADFLGSRYGISFAITTYDQRAHPLYPAGFVINIDTDRDGSVDYVIFTQELNGFAVTGASVTYVIGLKDEVPEARAYFYTDADLNSSNVVLTVPAAALGVVDADADRNIMRSWTIAVDAYDNYFSGYLSDWMTGIIYTPGWPRYVASPWLDEVPVGGSVKLSVAATPKGAESSPSQTGLLLLYRDARDKQQADVITVTP